MSKNLAFFFLVIALILSVLYFKYTKAENEAGMKDPGVCKNEESDWVKIPQGFYKRKNGKCVEGAPPLPPERIGAPSPETKTLPFVEGESTILFEYKGGPLILEAKGGEVKITQPSGKSFYDYPGKDGLGEQNNKLERGWFVVSKKSTSGATGVKVTKFW